MAAIAGCAPHPRPPRSLEARRFYLTKDAVQGNQVLGACARGYHVASRFELLDVSSLRYDPTVGLTSADSGMGPPSRAAAYGSEDPSGWVRTGGSSRYTDTDGAPGSAFANCAVWSTSSADAYGTVAYLIDRFTTDGSPATVWNGQSVRCNLPHHVWCIEDSAGAAAPSDDERPRRRRFGSMD